MREHTAELDGHLVFWREAERSSEPVLWLHGVPDSSDLWLPLLERAGGIALDLPGFGRSGKRADFPYDIAGYARFLERFVGHLGLRRVRLVCHDWGAVGLAWAMRHPERVTRIVAVDVIPFLPGFRWHPVARLWRRRGIGELAMGATGRRGLRAVTGMPDAWARQVIARFDHGTQRAILRLYRASPPEVLAAAGAHLDRIAAPTLVLWGERDRFLAPRYAGELTARLPAARCEVVSGSGHWPWVGDDDVSGRILQFLAA